jgi:CDP-paratose synthetase
MKKKNILVTGGTGYLALNFIKENYKNYNFYCIVNKKKIPERYCKNSLIFKQNNIDSLIKFIKKVKPELTIHMATKYLKCDKINFTKDIINSNILFGSYLLQALDQCGFRKIINFSSIWQNIEKKNIYSPQNFYAATKEAFEKILQYFIKRKNFKVLTLKIYDTYGYNDTRDKFLQFLIRKIQKKERIILENKSRKISLVHYKDINLGLKIAINYILNKKFISKTFSLRSKKVYSLEYIINIFKNIHNLNFKISWKEINNKIKLNQSFKNLPGWNPKISLKQGLQEFKI